MTRQTTTGFLMKRHHLLILTLILLLAAAGRILSINAQSIWEDEAFTYYAITQPNMLDIIIHDVHPPLYFFAMRAWYPLTGPSELALRFFSVLPSMLSVAFVYHLAREVQRARGQSGGSVVPVLAALLMALADAENALTHEVRMYTLHVLWVILSMWGFLRWIRTGGRRWLVLWVLATTALVYTHYLGVYIPLVQGLYALFFLRGRQRWLAVGALVVTGALFLPWALGVAIHQPANAEGNFYESTSLETLVDMRIKWFGQQWPLTMGLALLGLVTLEYGQRVRLRWRPFNIPVLLVMWLVIPIALTFLLNLWIPILLTYRLSQITPAVVLMVALGLANVRRPERFLLVGAIVVYSLATVDFYRWKPPWREVAQNAARYARPGELALSELGGPDYHILYYFDQMMPPDTESRSLRQWRKNDPGSYPTGLPALLSIYPTVWLVDWSPDTAIFDRLTETGHVPTALMTVDFLGNALDVYRFDTLPEDPVTAYDNGMTLRAAAIHPDILRVDLWWSVDDPLPADYTTSAFLLDETGRLVAQYDSYPFVGERPTNTWTPGEVVYDPKSLVVADGGSLPPGSYAVGVQIYTWTPEGTRRIQTIDGEEWAVVGQIER